MKTTMGIFLVSIATILTMGACKNSKENQASENSNFSFSDQPLSGTVLGQPWKAQAAAFRVQHLSSSNWQVIDIYGEPVSQICDPLANFGKVRASIILKSSPAVGFYKNQITDPNSTVEPLSISDGQSTPTNYIASATELNITEMTTNGFNAQLHAFSEGQYEIDGDFTVVNCPTVTH